jgi:FAD/FMN-containing dehydrogenase
VLSHAGRGATIDDGRWERPRRPMRLRLPSMSAGPPAAPGPGHAARELAALDRAIAGSVLLPGADGYERVRKPPIARFHDVRPQAVVLCRTPEDVAATLALADRAGLDTAVRSGGHCFAGRSSTRGVVIDVSLMRAVTLDGDVATIGAGARLGEVYDALGAERRTIAAGCGPTVGIAGLALGGGLGILGRRHGLTSDQVVGAQVVLADGRIVDCDEEREPDLFWALRGAGGGQFGVVTALALATLPAPEATTLHLTWPVADAVAVLDAWQELSPDAPDELAASLLVTAPGDPGREPTVHVFGAMIGSVADATDLLAVLVGLAGADPASSTLKQVPYREAKRRLAEHGPGGEDGPAGANYSRSEFFRRPLPREAVAALIAQLGDARAAGASRELDLSPWGGAYNRVPAAATAFAHRSERFLIKQATELSPGATACETDAARAWLARSWELTHAYGSGGVYQNFPDPELADWPRAYHRDNLARLLRVKAQYDPGDRFRFHQSLPAVSHR